jgi:hypothetical protein
VTCECCSETFVDEVGLMLVEEAVLAYRDALVEKATRDRAAWADAEHRSAQALAAATGGGG